VSSTWVLIRVSRIQGVEHRGGGGSTRGLLSWCCWCCLAAVCSGWADHRSLFSPTAATTHTESFSLPPSRNVALTFAVQMSNEHHQCQIRHLMCNLHFHIDRTQSGRVGNRRPLGVKFLPLATAGLIFLMETECRCGNCDEGCIFVCLFAHTTSYADDVCC